MHRVNFYSQSFLYCFLCRGLSQHTCPISMGAGGPTQSYQPTSLTHTTLGSFYHASVSLNLVPPGGELRYEIVCQCIFVPFILDFVKLLCNPATVREGLMRRRSCWSNTRVSRARRLRKLEVLISHLKNYNACKNLPGESLVVYNEIKTKSYVSTRSPCEPYRWSIHT